MRNTKAFTLIELMVVILIVGILAAASVPLMRGRVDSAKWSEANATAGTIRSAVRVAFAENPGATLTGKLDNATLQTTLGFNAADLTGTYFVPGDYEITAVSANGIATVTVTSNGSGNKPAAGSKTLDVNGDWK
jgi:prepilin-type N-terminal cleavage/methylation domain-containing protein